MGGESKAQANQELRSLTPSGLSPSLSVALEKHPELLDLIARWPALPEAVRDGILAMIRGAEK
jgi:hypothetical protein